MRKLQSESPLRARDSLNGFQVMGKIGEGSFGVIYKARRLSDNGIYVLKEIALEDEGGFRSSMSEVQLL